MIRQDLEIKAYDTLRCRCNELADSLGAIVSSGRECPSDLIEAVCTIIWAAGQAEVRSLPSLDPLTRPRQLQNASRPLDYVVIPSCLSFRKVLGLTNELSICLHISDQEESDVFNLLGAVVWFPLRRWSGFPEETALPHRPPQNLP